VRTLAFLYRIEGDRRFADRAWAELDAAARFKDWNPRHFLDTAEMTHAFALGYDWLYDCWTPEQRTVLRKAIIEKGFEPGLSVYREKRSWSRSLHNWNQVCNGGLGMGALAIADEEPAPCGEVLTSALRSLPLAMRCYGPDGAWAEGPGYWHYATSYNVTILAALETALGKDFGLSRISGFSLCGLFPIHATGSSDLSFNYADAGEGTVRASEMWWLARRFGMPGYAWYAGTHHPGDVLDIVWYEPEARAARPRDLAVARHFRGADIVTMRSSWASPEATWVGVKAGDNKVNHSHLDLGSFVMDVGSARWVSDLGSDDYNLPGYFGDKRWTYYRLRAESHNTIVYGAALAGPDQDPKAVAPIVSFRQSRGNVKCEIDLTAPYAAKVTSARRTFTLRDRTLTVHDDMTAGSAVDAWWFLHTRADVQVAPDGRAATLAIGGRRLLARIVDRSPGRFEVMAAAPLPGSPNPPNQRSNSGVRKLAIRLPSITALHLTVELAPEE
jgi:hypothetical protein